MNQVAIAFAGDLTRKIAEFLTEIGIEVVASKWEDDSFLPGVLVDHGRLLVDESKLKYPADLLHEAGHLAVAPAELRKTLTGEVVLPDRDMTLVELEAIAWSYAAAVHLKIDPALLFHEGGYKGRSAGLLLNVSMGVFPGLNGLEKDGMAASETRARQFNLPAYPAMIRWLNS